MVAEQEEEEGGLQWRIDAEVRLALQEAQAGEATRMADLKAQAAALEAALAQVQAREAALEANVKAWQEAVPARDTEIQNLQVQLVSCHFGSPVPCCICGDGFCRWSGLALLKDCSTVILNDPIQKAGKHFQDLQQQQPYWPSVSAGLFAQPGLKDLVCHS